MTRPYRKLEKQQQKQPPPEDQLTCIEASQGERVYEYFNGILSEAASQRFEEHLLLCFRCQDTVLSLDAIFDLLAEKKDVFFPKL